MSSMKNQQTNSTTVVGEESNLLLLAAQPSNGSQAPHTITTFNSSSSSSSSSVKNIVQESEASNNNNTNNNMNTNTNNNNIKKETVHHFKEEIATTMFKTPTSPAKGATHFSTSSNEQKQPDEFNLDAKLRERCTNKYEKAMLFMVANRVNVMAVFVLTYILALLYGGFNISWQGNLLNLAVMLLQIFINKKNINSAMSYGDSFPTSDGYEKVRMILSFLIFTIRFFLHPTHKIIFIPLTFMWFTGSNNLYFKSTFWGLFPTYYMISLFSGSVVYFGLTEFITNGFTEELVNILIEHLGIGGCVWIFSYYMINVTGFLKYKVDKLQETRQLLENALEARSRFMAHISHEFRCPIMSSIGCLELLKETPLNEKQNELVDTIVSSNSVLLLLIEDILQIVKIEHESAEVPNSQNMRTFNLYESLMSMKGIISGYASIFKVKLTFNIDERIKDSFIVSNASKLHQIISNLLTNAVKASKQDDEVVLSCQVMQKQDNNLLVKFNCRDNGSGIPAHLIESIFEPFVQLQHNLQSKVPSSGLGLTTVAHLVKSMEGRIDVFSEVGKGSTFIVELPFKLSDQPSTDKIDSMTEAENKRIQMHLNVHQNYLSLMSNLENREKKVEEAEFNSEIIIAEDNPINRKVIVKMITSLGYKTDFVADGAELVERFNPKTHKVVITDMNMPNMNGLEAAKELRNKYGSDFSIYLLTGNVTVSLVKTDEVGIIDGVLTKPCSKKDLGKIIASRCTK